jgi:hypothetical protein
MSDVKGLVERMISLADYLASEDNRYSAGRLRECADELSALLDERRGPFTLKATPTAYHFLDASGVIVPPAEVLALLNTTPLLAELRGMVERWRSAPKQRLMRYECEVLVDCADELSAALAAAINGKEE